MEYLIALISSGKRTWSEVANLITKNDWKKVFIICNDFTFDKFTSEKPNLEKLKIDENKFEESIKLLTSKFKEVTEMEISLNINSGTGKEHTIVIQSILKSGIGFKFVNIKDNKVNTLNLFDSTVDYNEKVEL